MIAKACCLIPEQFFYHKVEDGARRRSLLASVLNLLSSRLASPDWVAHAPRLTVSTTEANCRSLSLADTPVAGKCDTHGVRTVGFVQLSTA